jgi:hypothetical protein
MISPVLKHPTFSEEMEWRLVSRVTAINDPHVRVRDGLTRIVPFYEFMLARDGEELVLGDLKIGPSASPELAGSGVSAAIHVHRVHANALTFSSVPFRAW